MLNLIDLFKTTQNKGLMYFDGNFIGKDEIRFDFFYWTQW